MQNGSAVLFAVKLCFTARYINLIEALPPNSGKAASSNSELPEKAKLFRK